MCKSNSRWNNDTIDLRLKQDERPIIRVSNYINYNMTLEWKCIECNNQWSGVINNIINKKSGCPTCALKDRTRTNSDVDKLVNPKNIIRLEQYKSSDMVCAWECKICNHNWEASLNGILQYAGDGCPKCNIKEKGRLYSLTKLDKVNKILIEKNLTLLSPYTKIEDYHEIKCNICNYRGFRTLETIIYDDNGCRSCAGKLPLTNDLVDSRIAQINQDILRIGNVIDSDTKITWKCLLCNNIWNTTPSSILNNKSGCPRCRTLGITTDSMFARFPKKKYVHGLLYLIEGYDGYRKFLKIGITERTVTIRFSHNIHKLKLKEVGSKSMLFYDAFKLEQQILTIFAKLSYTPVIKFGGQTECFVYSQEIIDYFNSL